MKRSIIFLFCVIELSLSTYLYTNPVIGSTNTPDPGVIQHGKYFFATTTSGDTKDAFPIWRSEDLVNWKLVGHVFPSADKPKWAVQDFWAPEIHKISDGHFNVYFAARNAQGTLCVGVATSDKIEGPYKDQGGPLVYTPGMGNIDPTFFEDTDGSRYLIWKVDGNAVQKPTPIYIRQLNHDGLSFASGSKQIELITNTLPWEGAVTEAPWIIRDEDHYYLFYSGNGYAGPLYAVGVARSNSSILGPYEKYGDPILGTNSGTWIGPGHCSVIPVNNGTYSDWFIIYHAWPKSMNQRDMMLDRIDWSDGWPYIVHNTPSNTPQPYPIVHH